MTALKESLMRFNIVLEQNKKNHKIRRLRFL